jgi:excisionase family DNA binding protein
MPKEDRLVASTTLPEVLTTHEVAAALKLTPARVAQLAREGHIPAFRLTERGDFRFRAEDVERLIAGKENSP